MKLPRLRLLILPALCVLLGACVNQSITTTRVDPVKTPAKAVPEDQLLDVAVVVFDPGLEDAGEDKQVFPEVRKAESRFMPMQLSEALQESGAWGAVRVVPNDTQISDVMVHGKILHSDGEELQLQITATDSRGDEWFDKKYTGNASHYSYETTTRANYDAFQQLYNNIANDLLEHLEKLPAEKRTEVRVISELAFARSFSPDAFNGYLDKKHNGKYEIKRLPAEDDPMLARVRDIRDRDRQYVDTLQGYYTNFDAQMYGPYQEWRKNSYDSVVELQKIQTESTRNLILGGVAVLAGIAAATTGDSTASRTAGQVGVLGGGYLIKSGLDKRNEAQLHVAELDELGASLEAEVAPQNVALEDHTVTLTGNVEQQYAQWREVLAEIYRTEIGALELPEKAAGTTDTL